MPNTKTLMSKYPLIARATEEELSRLKRKIGRLEREGAEREAVLAAEDFRRLKAELSVLYADGGV